MEKHCNGIKFREWNAGFADNDMKDNGFNIEVKFDPANGFVGGGNKDNCGFVRNFALLSHHGLRMSKSSIDG